MELFNQFTFKLYDFIPAPVFGLLSVVIGILGDLLAFLAFPGFSLNNMISDLGSGSGGLFFNLGLIIAGLFALFFYWYLCFIFKNEGKHPKVTKIAFIFSTASCVFYSLVGFFPSIYTFSVIYSLHGLFALLTLLTGVTYLLSFGYLLSKSPSFPRFIAILPILTSIPMIIFLLTWLPIVEWIMSIFLSIWISAAAIFLIYKKIKVLEK